MGRRALAGPPKAEAERRRRPAARAARRLDTGEVDTVLVPCGHTLAARLPLLRGTSQDAARGPVPGRLAPRARARHHPDPATTTSSGGSRTAPKLRPLRDRPPSAGQDTTELDELITELDEEITRSGMRGKVAPGPARAAAPLDPAPPGRPGPARRKVAPRTVGQDLHRAGRQDVPAVDVRHPDLPDLRAGPRRRHPGRPGHLRLRRAARDAVHFAALFDRFMQNLRRYLGYDVQYFAAVEPQRRLAPHVHIAIRGTVSRAELRQVLAATYHQVWWPDATRRSGSTADQLPVWDEDIGDYLDPDTGEVLPDLGRGAGRHRRR